MIPFGWTCQNLHSCQLLVVGKIMVKIVMEFLNDLISVVMSPTGEEEAKKALREETATLMALVKNHAIALVLDLVVAGSGCCW